MKCSVCYKPLPDMSTEEERIAIEEHNENFQGLTSAQPTREWTKRYLKS